MSRNTNTALTFPQFSSLPPELRESIWVWAAEERGTDFKRFVPDYIRFWHFMHNAPCLKYLMHSLPRIVIDKIRALFWPLFLTNKESYKTASQYIVPFQHWGAMPRLAVNFLDRFILGSYTIAQMVLFSSNSDKNLRELAGVAISPSFPSTSVDVTHQLLLDDISRAMHVAVPAKLFTRASYNIACQEILLRCRSLRTVYMDVTGILNDDPTPCLQWTEPEDTMTSRNFIELSYIENGQFRLKWEDKSTFDRVYTRKFDQLVTELYGTRVHTLCVMRRGMVLDEGRTSAWEGQERWKRDFMDYFSERVGWFLKKGIVCVLVCDCKIPGYMLYRPSTILPASWT
ncbi:hypothetical protein K449DRAFT_427850 [Hypoxylon sp. EC38]|nr:hypothetical protein K449DRAFT_427850 [Hypoxylon sp. EC38]